MNRIVIFVTLAAALLLAACSSAAVSPTQEVSLPAVESAGGDKPQTEAYPAQGQSAEGAYPAQGGAAPGYPAPYDASASTGVAIVDQVLAAAASGNADGLRGLLVFETAPCTTAEGLGGPPKCKEGEADGTPLEVFPSLGAEGYFVRKNELPEGFLAGPFSVLAVYEVKAGVTQEEYYPSGKWGVVLSTVNSSGGTSYVTLRVDDAGIVRADYDLDLPGAEFRDAGNYLLPLQ